MNLRSQLAVLGQLIRDTFRQATASGVCWMMLSLTAVCAVFCLSVSVSGDVSLHGGDETVYFLPHSHGGAPPASTTAPGAAASAASIDPELARREGVEVVAGRVSLAFGALSFEVSRERADAVRFLELILAGGIAGTLGLLLALVWTAGFVPTFLEPAAATVLLARPVSRRCLLVGKYLGVLTFVGLQVTIFVALTWLALGLRTGVWDATYWLCVPLLLVQFTAFYAFSVFLGVMTRSTVACVFGALLFWLLSWGINYGSVMVGDRQASRNVSTVAATCADAAYWISPKPIDAALILFNALDAKQHFSTPQVFSLLESDPSFSPSLSILSSLVLSALILSAAAREFGATDY